MLKRNLPFETNYTYCLLPLAISKNMVRRKKISTKFRTSLSKKYPDELISISHSHQALVGITSKQSCGIDIEYNKARSENMVDYLLTEIEKKLIFKHSYNQQQAILLAWTIKEACFKAEASGNSPHDYQIHNFKKGYFEVSTQHTFYQVYSLNFLVDYTVSIAYSL